MDVYEFCYNTVNGLFVDVLQGRIKCQSLEIDTFNILDHVELNKPHQGVEYVDTGGSVKVAVPKMVYFTEDEKKEFTGFIVEVMEWYSNNYQIYKEASSVYPETLRRSPMYDHNILRQYNIKEGGTKKYIEFLAPVDFTDYDNMSAVDQHRCIEKVYNQCVFVVQNQYFHKRYALDTNTTSELYHNQTVDELYSYALSDEGKKIIGAVGDVIRYVIDDDKAKDHGDFLSRCGKSVKLCVRDGAEKGKYFQWKKHDQATRGTMVDNLWLESLSTFRDSAGENCKFLRSIQDPTVFSRFVLQLDELLRK